MQRATAILAIGVVGAVGLAGCSKKSSSALPSDPKAALVASVSNLGGESSTSITLSFKDPNGALLKAMSKDSSKTEIGYIKRVLAGSLKISVAAAGGGKLSDQKAKHDFSLELIEGSTTDASIAVIAGDLYAHIDASFLKQVGGANAVTAIGGVAPALASGGTIKIPGILKASQDFAKGLGATPKTTPSVDPQAIANDLKAAFSSAVSATKAGSDTYDVSISIKPLVTAFLSLGTKYVSAFGGAAASSLKGVEGDAAKIPNGTVTGVATVNGDKLSEFALNLDSVGALAKAQNPKADVPDLKGAQVVVAFGSSTSGLTVPNGATEFSIATLFAKLASGFGSSSSSSSSSSVGTAQIPCSQVPAWITIPCRK